MSGEERDGIRYLITHGWRPAETSENAGGRILSPQCPVLMPSLAACAGTAQLPSHTRSCRTWLPDAGGAFDGHPPSTSDSADSTMGTLAPQSP
jgi:hypothetical protein